MTLENFCLNFSTRTFIFKGQILYSPMCLIFGFLCEGFDGGLEIFVPDLQLHEEKVTDLVLFEGITWKNQAKTLYLKINVTLRT